MSRKNRPPNFNVGKWLPKDKAALDKWVEMIIKEAPGMEDAYDIQETDPDGKQESRYKIYVSLLPPIKELKDLIEDDPEVNMFFHQMFSQIPLGPPYDEDAMGRPQIRNYHMLLLALNYILTRAPKYRDIELVAVPIHAILTWPMATVGGYAAFLNDKVNKVFKRILNNWGKFLKSPDSAYVLNRDPENGWLGELALKAMPNFKETWVCDPTKAHWGFKSWDDFFVRRFREEARPVASPGDRTVICNACESAPLDAQTDVRARNRFWIKSQPYSMLFLLANDKLAPQFIGGTVYQAFLSPLSYHRFHSPVSGTIVKAYIKDGSYYSTSQAMGFTAEGTVNSQGYLSEVATRGLYFIQADNSYIGLMCFVAIGMAEVSTVEITVYEGQHVEKGQELGMFHFGGSTHVLVFRPNVELTFDFHGQIPNPDAENINVRERIATVPYDYSS